MTAFSNYLEPAILNATLRNVGFTLPTAWYVSLHTADPVETGASELVPGANAYVRKAVTFGAPVPEVSGIGHVCINTNQLQWTNMPAATLTHSCVWDALTVGNMLYGGPMVNPVTTVAGTTFQIEIGEYAVTTR